MASPKPERLTAPQRDALVAVGMGAMTFYGAQQRYKGYFSFAPFFLFASRNACPVVKSANASCQVLVRLGLVDTIDAAGSSRPELTEAGRLRFEEVLTAAERAGMKAEALEIERRARVEAQGQRKKAWQEKHADEREALRNASHARGSERNQQQHRMSTIATLLGEGANNVDELVAELRGIVQRLKVLDEERKVSSARHDELSEPPDNF